MCAVNMSFSTICLCENKRLGLRVYADFQKVLGSLYECMIYEVNKISIFSLFTNVKSR